MLVLKCELVVSEQLFQKYRTNWHQMKKKEKREHLKGIPSHHNVSEDMMSIWGHWVGKDFLVSGFALARLLKLSMHRKGGMETESRNILKVPVFSVFPLLFSFLYLA